MNEAVLSLRTIERLATRVAQDVEANDRLPLEVALLARTISTLAIIGQHDEQGFYDGPQLATEMITAFERLTRRYDTRNEPALNQKLDALSAELKRYARLTGLWS